MSTLNDFNIVTIYKHRAFTMMNIYKSEEDEKFCEWLNKFEYIADIIGVPDKRMIKFFEEMVDKNVQLSMKKILFYVNFSELSYDETIDNYLHHFYLCKQIGYKNRFNIRDQYEYESIGCYAQRLRKLYKKCDYGNEKDKLLNKFIDGLREDSVKFYLSEEIFSSYDELVATAIQVEKVTLITFYRDRALERINKYDEKKQGQFHVWLNKFEYVADKIKVPDDRKQELFYNMMDSSVNTDVYMSDVSIDFDVLSYDETTQIYYNYFNHLFPFTGIDLKVALFYLRDQYEQETIKEYADNLKKLFDKCDLPDERLCYKFKDGLYDDNIRDYSFEFPDQTFEEIVAITIKYCDDNKKNVYKNKTLSRISVYHPDKEGSFYLWLNKFEYVTSSIKIPDDMIIEIFNNMVHDDVHTSVKTTYNSVEFSQLSYDEIVKKYLCAFTSTDELYLHRDRFMSRVQYEHETIENYFNNLKRIIDKCEYEENTIEILCKQFIDGLRENDIKTHLKKNLNLTIDQLADEAIKFEKANQITYYLNRILLMMDIYNLDQEGYFYVWLNCFEYLTTLIDVPDNKMIELFHKMVNNDVRIAVQNAFSSVDFSELPYEKIIDYYLLHLPSPHGIDVDKQRFKTRKQFKGEPVEYFAVNLRKLRDKCYYKSGTNYSCRERFLKGLRDESTIVELNEIPDLSFEQMVVWVIEFNIKGK